jgi:hypothetical protein
MTGRNEGQTDKPRERDLVIAYLSYALEDVQALSKVGVQLLHMTIASLSEDAQSADSEERAQPALPN